MCDLSAALVSALKNKKRDAAISAAAEKNKKEDAGLANIGNGLTAPRSQLGFGTVPRLGNLYSKFSRQSTHQERDDMQKRIKNNAMHAYARMKHIFQSDGLGEGQEAHVDFFISGAPSASSPLNHLSKSHD